MKSPVWISPDQRYIIAFDKVAAVRPEGVRGDVMVLLRSGRLFLDPANAKHFTEAFLRFHTPDQPKPTQPKTQS